MAALAQTDETRIRSDAGGIYQSPAFGNGSVTSFPGAKVILRDAADTALDEHSIKYWYEFVTISTYPPPPNPVLDRFQKSGGQFTIRFDYRVFSGMYPTLPGGTVEIMHNGVLVDRDRLYR